MTELLPCPFCGGHLIRHSTKQPNKFKEGVVRQIYVFCGHCKARGESRGTVAEAYKAWNTRTAKPVDEAELARVLQDASIEWHNGKHGGNGLYLHQIRAILTQFQITKRG